MSEKKLSIEPFIGEHCKIVNSKLGKYTEIGIYNYFENVIFGDYSYTGQFYFVQNTEIGMFSNIAAMVRIGPTDHPMERPSLHHFTYRRRMYGFDEQDDVKFFSAREMKKTLIGHDTWIGHGAIIMPGVKIGNGAVIGCGALVTKDIKPYEIAVGLPAKVIRKRFKDEIIEKLEVIKWWNWSYDKIKDNLQDFYLDIDSFVHKHYENR